MAGSEPRPLTVLSPSGEPIACRDEAEAACVRAWVAWYKKPHAFRDAERQDRLDDRATVALARRRRLERSA